MMRPQTSDGVQSLEDTIELRASADGQHPPGDAQNLKLGSGPQGLNPFLCNVCKRSYSRIDHLARHYRSHTNEKPFLCHLCDKDFGRADLLKRHVAAHDDDKSARKKRKASPPATRPRVSQACMACAEAKLKCEQTKPCRRCQLKQIVCEYHPARRRQTLEPRGASNDESANQKAGGAANSGSYEPESTLQYQSRTAPSRDIDFPTDTDLNHLPTPVTFAQASHMPSVTPAPLENDLQMTFDNSSLADFLREIMMPISPVADMRNFGGETAFQPYEPRDVLNFGVDNSFDLPDFAPEFSFQMMEDMPQGPALMAESYTQMPGSGTRTPVIRNGINLGMQAFRESIWQWTPAQQDHGYAEQVNLSLPQDDVTFARMRVTADGSLLEPQIDQRTRDRILAMVLATCEQGRFARVVASFPSTEILTNLLHNFIDFHSSIADSWVHLPTLKPSEMTSEMLSVMIAMGAVYSGSQSIRKLGFAIQETVRLALPKVFEDDNRTTRHLQVLQTYALQLDIGLWSGDRRKMEMAESFAQPLVTMMRRAGRFRRAKRPAVAPSHGDTADILEAKWRDWVETESFKRLTFHLLIRDMQTSMASLVPPLISYAEVSVEMPMSSELWRAQSAIEWKDVYLTKTPQLDERLPSLSHCIHDFAPLSESRDTVDMDMAVLVVLYGIWTMIWEYRQLNTVMKLHPNTAHWNSGLISSSLHQEVCQLLQHFRMDTSDWSDGMQPDAVLVYERSLMNLHVSFEDLQLFAGKEGEDEARRVYPLLTQWAKSRESRQAVWHAGQVLRAAKQYRPKALRDFSAIALYHASLALWARAVVSSPPRKQARQSSTDKGSPATAESDFVWLDGEDGPNVQKFLILNRGTPAIRRLFDGADSDQSNTYAALRDPKAVMEIAIDILRRKSKGEDKSCPPLVENLSQLMKSLGNAAQGMKS